MRVTIVDRELTLRGRLRERLARAAELRCAEHGQPVVAVRIDARGNGWFDARSTTCCEGLEQQVKDIVKERC
jgi:hypothetical protein